MYFQFSRYTAGSLGPALLSYLPRIGRMVSVTKGVS
jgi:hypothetical protein